LELAQLQEDSKMAENLFGDWSAQKNWLDQAGKNINNFGKNLLTTYGQQASPYSVRPTAPKKVTTTATSSTGGSKAQGILDLFNITGNRGSQPEPETTVPSGPARPSAPAVNPIDAIFAPMFESLAQREQLANQRYEANREQVTNIYGQITGARSQDIAATGEAFRRLTDAASARSTAVNTSIDESEAARLRNNQAALESMGLGGLSTSQGDIASQGAAMAKNTNQLNAENWQNLLTAMGATSQDLARSDVTGFNYRMGEDLGQLRGAREEFQQGIGQERTSLLGQQAQASFDYQQAQQAAAASASAAAQRAASDASDRLAKQQAEALKGSGPVTQIIANRFNSGLLTAAEAAKATNAINEWFTNVPPPAGAGKWNSGSAKNSILGLAKGSLTQNEQSAIVAVFDAMSW
jgi:hypothetical protein